MNKLEIKKRRFKKHVAPIKVVRIVKLVNRYRVIVFIPSLTHFGYWERVKSLFSFKERTELPRTININGRNMNISQKYYGE